MKAHPQSLSAGGPVVVLVAALFAMPIAVASGLYLSGWRPAPSAAHGTLVSPPLPLAGTVLGANGGKTVRLGDFHGKWLLLHLGPADCPADCERQLFAMQQVQAAQGRERERVRRVFVAQGRMPVWKKDSLSRNFPGVAMVTGYGKDWPERWSGEWKTFLIDPMGNLVMAYGANADPSGMRKDLARLLAYSWVG